MSPESIPTARRFGPFLRFLPLGIAVLALLLYGKAALENDLIFDAGERVLLLGSGEEWAPAPLAGAVLGWEKHLSGADIRGDGGDAFQWFGAILAALAGLAAYAAYRGALGLGPGLAVWAAAAWIVHPAFSSAVFAGVQGRGVLLALLFAAGAVAAWVRPGPVWGVLAALLGAWAALSHPQALVVLLLLPLIEVQDRDAAGSSPTRWLALLLALIAAVGVWLWSAGLPGFAGALMAPVRSLGYAVTTALVPTWQALPEPTFSGWWGAAGGLRLGIGVVLLVLLALGFRAAGGRLRNPLGLALAWSGLTLLPVLQIFAQRPPYAERYLALPLFGLVGLVALVVSRLPGRSGAIVRHGLVLALPLAGLIALSAGRLDTFRDAERYHRQWVATSPDSAPAHLGLAVALTRQAGEGAEAQGTEALAAIRRAAELAPEDAAVQGSLGDFLFSQGQRPEAATAYRRGLELAPEDGALALRLGEVLLADGQPGEAAEAFRQAVGLRPGEATPRLRLATALARAGKADEAVAQFEEVLAEKPDDAVRQAQLRVDYGNLLADVGRTEEALAAYRRALELDPQLAKAHYNLGLTQLSLGQGEEAKGSFREAIALQPDYPEAHTNLGVVLASQGAVDEALEHYRTAVELRPDDGGTRFNLGQGLLLAGQVEEGLTELRRGVELAPGNPSGHLLLGRALLSLGRLGPAAESLQNALRLRPQGVEAMIPLAWILATAADDSVRDGETAVRLAESATHLTQYRNLDALNALAAAYAETGQFDRASQIVGEVIRRLEASGQKQEADLFRPFLERYRQQQPVRSGTRQAAGG
jgi:tetratricopeptide (TPR) repeat protein